MTKELLGFIGVGRMGAPMARRLIAAGYSLTVYDTNEAAVAPLVALGATQARSIAQVASAAETVFASLPTPEIVQAVAAAVATGNRVRTFIDLSTTGPRVAAEVGEALAASGITAIDCPVSGGVMGAEKGTLAVVVAGPRDVYDRLKPALDVIGKSFYVGERPGQAQVVKLVNNLLSVTALAITSEGMAMGVKAGIDATIMLDAINAGSGRNSATQDKFPRNVVPRTFDMGFALALSYKDIRLCLEEAERLGVPTIVGNAVKQVLGIAKATQGPDADLTTIVKAVESWAGVEVK
ncbi:MAG: NAD(P)-dependent oxidoreductase [Alphaproteobacteria bacterium]|nr:NAD(P)-dependent oxidoreductase [Alphaproteobacteria bacterium]